MALPPAVRAAGLPAVPGPGPALLLRPGGRATVPAPPSGVREGLREAVAPRPAARGAGSRALFKGYGRCYILRHRHSSVR